MSTVIKLMIRYPSIIASSIVNSIKTKSLIKISLITSIKTKIIKKRRAILKVNGRSLIGVYTTRVGEIFRINKDYTFIELGEDSTMELDGRVAIGPGCRILLGKNANLKIGNRTEITGGTKILVEKNIEIGADCLIAWDVQIMDTDWHTTKSNKGKYINDVVIKDNVWIASGVKIMQGVTIGEGAVIAAGSIVTEDIPGNVLAGGIPAKVLKEDYFWKV